VTVIVLSARNVLTGDAIFCEEGLVKTVIGSSPSTKPGFRFIVWGLQDHENALLRDEFAVLVQRTVPSNDNGD
jgi:hypothetical protein